MKKRLLTCGILCALILNMMGIIHAQEDRFIIEQIANDGTATQVASSSTYQDAKVQYDTYAKEDGNVILRDETKIWNVKYGVAILTKSDACDVNVSYTQGTQSGYTNGCYGIDAAYLSTSEDGSFMELVLSNAFGTFSSDDVTLLPIEQSAQPSTYQVKDGYLYHEIKSQMENDRTASSIKLGKAPKYLSEGASYYSYDTHYFYLVDTTYQGYYDMIDDLRTDAHTHAINKEAPYYNYYQYLTHRSTTNYSEEEIDAYIDEHLHISSGLTSYKSIGTSAHAILTQSILKHQGSAFLQYQDEFGVNALMMMALSMNESAMGRSYLAYTRNNLFGHAAFDSAVEENASRYQNASTSIYSHALHYINNSYLNPDQFQFHGGWFGNKASGMNVSYASDPYWGEKAAQYYQRIDEVLGYKDEDTYALGIVSTPNEVMVHKEASKDSEVLYTSGGMRDFAFVLLAKEGEWYKVQSDPSYSSSSIYDFESSVGYVLQSDLDIVLQKDLLKEKHRLLIQFDAGDGIFENGESLLTLEVEAGKTPSVLTPKKDGYLFQSWDQELKPASKAMTYTAQYDKVTAATITSLPKQAYEAGEFLDVKGGILSITLAGGDVLEIPIDSTMVSGFDRELTGEQTIQVSYQGVHASYIVQVQKGEVDQVELQESIQNVLKDIEDVKSLTSSQEETLLTLKQQLDKQNSPTLSQEEYRKLDSCIQHVYGKSLQIILSDEDVDLQVSGFAIAQPMDAPSFLPSVLKFAWKKGVEEEAQSRLADIAEGNDYSLETTFTLSGSYNLHPLSLQDDLIISIQKPENTQSNRQYLVLHYMDGEVAQVITQQSDGRITFVADAVGEYALVSRTTSSTYTGTDIIENNTMSNNGFDFFQLLSYIGILLFLLILVLMTIIIRKKRNRNKPSLRKKQHTRKPKHRSESVPIEKQTSFLRTHNIQADDPIDYNEDDTYKE